MLPAATISAQSRRNSSKPFNTERHRPPKGAWLRRKSFWENRFHLHYFTGRLPLVGSSLSTLHLLAILIETNSQCVCCFPPRMRSKRKALFQQVMPSFSSQNSKRTIFMSFMPLLAREMGKVVRRLCDRFGLMDTKLEVKWFLMATSTANSTTSVGQTLWWRRKLLIQSQGREVECR